MNRRRDKSFFIINIKLDQFKIVYVMWVMISGVTVMVSGVSVFWFLLLGERKAKFI